MNNTPSRPLEIRLIVFDWDGTLMNSEAQIVSCMHAAIEDLKLPPRSDEQIRNIIGLGLWEAIDSLYAGKEKAFHAEFTDRYRVHWFASNGSSELFAGAMDTVSRLHAAGYLLAVATGKGRKGLDKVLRETQMEHLFHATRCSDESGSKPHPAMLEQIMATLVIDASQTLMVGDTEYDLEMATNAGTHSLGVSHGVHSAERLSRHRPLAILNNIEEIGGWIEIQCRSASNFDTKVNSAIN